MKQTDYCGIASGKDADKAALFTTFYGTLETAPMITECPISMECKLVQTVDFPTHDIFIGEVVETYCDDSCITAGAVDFSLVRPILFVMNDRSYWELGKRFANAWDIGKELASR